MCKTHNTFFRSFKCYECNTLICPKCLNGHPHKNKLVRAEVIGHFLTYNDSSSSSSETKDVFIWTYNVVNKLLDVKTFKGARYEQNSILIQYVVYLTGGVVSMSGGNVSKAFNDVFSYDTKTGVGLTAKSPMPTEACFNALCTVTEAEFFSIGGKNPKGYLNICEKYIIAENKWVKLKPITLPRGNVSLCVYNCRIIYCIGGHNTPFNDIFESLDPANEANSWVVIKLESRDKFDARNGMMIVQNPLKNTIMIFGGCSLLGILKDVYEFNFNERTLVKQGGKLMKGAVFIERQPILWNDVYYFFEYGRRAGIYTYSLKDNKIARIKPKDYLGEANYKKIKI